jgi:translation initiation factor IF-2
LIFQSTLTTIMSRRNVLIVSLPNARCPFASAKLLQEPTGSSICAFCTHRLHTPRPPSHVQRRFLQGSHPASKPPATAAAAREYIDESDAQYAQSSSTSTDNWSMGRTGSSAGFGRPAFGRGSVSSFSRESIGRIGPAFGTGMIELTEEEKRARDLVNETAENAENKPRRLLNVYPSPGPESSRAGRPIPVAVPNGWDFGAREDRKLRALEQNLREGHRKDTWSGRTSRSVRHGFTITKFEGGKRSDPEAQLRESSQLESEADKPALHWSHLRRRGDNVMESTFSVPDDRFSQSQTQRGSIAKPSQYVPLTSKSVPRGGQGVLWGEMPQQSSSPRPQATGNTHLGINTEDSGAVTVSAVSNKTVTWHPLVPSAANKFGEMNSTVEVGRGDDSETSIFAPKRDDQKADKISVQEREREEGRRRSGDRFAEERATHFQRFEETPRGKERDKSRRRKQFITKDEQAEEEAAAARAELKRQKKRDKAAKKAVAPTPLFLPEYISVANLAAALRVRIEDFVQKMEELGFEETSYDHILNSENAGLIAMEYNFEPFIDRGESEDLKARPAPEDLLTLPSRPPVVTIMGHVDHGKTTLLDFLRKSSVAATEHGGITQHIGAFSVRMPSGKPVTFLDTPGHAAFLSMRQRGANVTDIVILVVAADDSVKPQTIEAINHAKVSKVPIIVAINKIDKEEANIERVKQDLARHGVEIEDFGGDTQVVCVSGKTGQGLDQLEENVVTLSEILDMRAERDGRTEGWVLEASIKSMGKVATVLVRRGTMRPGDFLVAGTTWARIRCLRNEAGVEMAEAGPGTPVQIEGWKEQPLAGDEVLQAPDESKAKGVIEYRLEKRERKRMAEDMKAINEARRLEHEKREQEKMEEKLLKEGRGENSVRDQQASEESTGPKQINFIVKADVSGSVEAVVDSVLSIGSAEVRPHVLRSGVGQLSEFDVEHAAAAKGYLINFNTGVDPKISQLAEAAKVKIIDHNIIYKLVDDVKATLSEYLKPSVTQRVLGEAEIAQVFDITIKRRQQKPIAGCKVKNGAIMKNSKIRVLRGGEKIFDGELPLFISYCITVVGCFRTFLLTSAS